MPKMQSAPPAVGGGAFGAAILKPQQPLFGAKPKKSKAGDDDLFS